MIVLSVAGVLGAFGRIPLAWVARAAGAGLSMAFAGQVAVRGATRSTQPGHLRVPGSFIPVLLIIGIFVILG